LCSLVGLGCHLRIGGISSWVILQAPRRLHLLQRARRSRGAMGGTPWPVFETDSTFSAECPQAQVQISQILGMREGCGDRWLVE
jgi:hypothetical protein